MPADTIRKESDTRLVGEFDISNNEQESQQDILYIYIYQYATWFFLPFIQNGKMDIKK